MDKNHWKHQLVQIKETYALTRLRFGLDIAPKIMSSILKTVLRKSDRIENATNSYVDDLLVEESLVSADKVIQQILMCS